MDLGPLEVALAGTGLLHLAMAGYAAGHVLLTRREPTASVLWLMFILVTPVVGPIFYAFMGLHRVNRTHRLRGARKAELRSRYASLSIMETRRRNQLERAPSHVEVLSEAVGRLGGRSLLRGNKLDVLVNGERAYPRMLAEIAAATHSVHLMSYIFDGDEVGQQFLDALAEAAKRGVEVRLLYDAIGAMETSERFFHRVRQSGVQVAVARPIHLWRWRRGLHFRNHRKLLICDGRVGFTGGMNLSLIHI